MIKYWNNYHDLLLQAICEHLELVIIALALSFISAILIITIFVNRAKSLNRLVYFFSALYSVPSYAFFALLIPISGLGKITAIIVLTLYSEYILLRNFSTGINKIETVIIETAIGLGMTEKQVLFKIQLPLAAKSIFSGIRVALTSVISIATIAASINAGGIGTILFDGLRTQNIFAIIWGLILTIILCLALTTFLKIIEKISLRTLGEK
ncbi:ABC transporter permease [Xylocopilactobacillus apis]|uniref:Glycine/betaine ABC transporter permease n=1 Tax=Xylocopilactobacillus apis TaxID=2932183 RepID=A0AAU9DJX0_9LACO|nr:ABC transporter permease [Xylocopilactobacillus apis]BDR57087.1 glycine/betaine ABC transporter permease [Xylocopilactobacillus apis]